MQRSWSEWEPSHEWGECTREKGEGNLEGGLCGLQLGFDLCPEKSRKTWKDFKQRRGIQFALSKISLVAVQGGVDGWVAG